MYLPCIEWRTLSHFHGTNILVSLLKYEELSYPKNQKMCATILVALLKMPPHYNHSSRENATPSSGASPLGSNKEVPPSPGLSLEEGSVLAIVNIPIIILDQFETYQFIHLIWLIFMFRYIAEFP